MAKASTVICDTNIIIEFFKNNKNVSRSLQSIGEDNISISVITVGELYFGALNKDELHKIHKKLSLIKIFPVSDPISRIFQILMYDYSLSHKLSVPDAFIAATVLHHNYSLYTLNKKDFVFIPGIVLFET